MSEDDRRRDPVLPEDARLTSLNKRLQQAQQEEAVRSGRSPKPVDSNYRLGNVVLSYLIGGPLGGALIGWVLDRWLGTSPWLLISLLVLGIVGGFWNIIKVSMKRPD